MTAPPPRRPWWRRTRAWAAVTALLVAAHPASVGPALYGRYAGWLPPSVLALYRPLPPIGGDSAAGKAWTAYIEWWVFRGVERGETNGTFHVNRSGLD